MTIPLLFLGDKWRDMRATLSPAFSSSKMKNMFGYIEQCAKNMSQFYLKELVIYGNFYYYVK